MERNFELEKPLAVVTGVFSGIGLELERQLAQRGHDLSLAANTGSLDEAARAVETAGENHAAVGSR